MNSDSMKMKKFINDPKNLVAELLEGMVLAFTEKVQLSNRNIVVRAVPKILPGDAGSSQAIFR